VSDHSLRGSKVHLAKADRLTNQGSSQVGKDMKENWTNDYSGSTKDRKIIGKGPLGVLSGIPKHR